MSATDHYLENNRSYQSNRGRGALPQLPSKHVAVVACMDARLDIFAVLGMGEGEAHIIRNAGGVVTDDVLRSLIISQRLLGTREIILVHHRDCGMMNFTDQQMSDELAAEVGERPLLKFYAFSDLEDDVRDGLHRIRHNPFLRHRDVRGFICDLETGRLHEVFERQ